MACVNPNDPRFQEILARVGNPLLAEIEFQQLEQVKPRGGEVQYQLPQGRELEEYIASEKTIRDLAARISDRIGISVQFESDRTKQYKGKLENGTAIVNLAYATLDTPIHEILGHPIIRAIKNKQSVTKRFVANFNKRFFDNQDEKINTGKTIEHEGHIYNVYKLKKYSNVEYRAYNFQRNEQIELSEEEFKDIINYSQLYQNLLKELEYGKGKEVLDRIKRDYIIKETTSKYKISQTVKSITNERIPSYKINDKPYVVTGEDIDLTYFDTYEEAAKFAEVKEIKYTLEEHQEEAIVELLGMMTAQKLNAVKDGKLISLLKRFLKEIKAFVKQLLDQKEVEIDKLPDNMTLGDIADLLAYSNSKLILPGNEVVYTTPDNQQFKTYAEASRHITELAKSVEDINLTTDISIEDIDNQINELQKQLDNFEFELEPFNKFVDVYTKQGRLRQNYWARRKDGTTVWTGGAKETLTGDDYDGFVLDIDRGDGRFITKITDEQAEKIYYDQENKFNITTKAGREKYAELETKIHNLKNNSLKGFIEKNKEYEQSKEIIEEWKKVNNIQYNPEEIYSRGQEFVSVVGAYSSFDVNLMMQNLLQHIEDNEKAGGEFTISAFTKPIDRQIGHLEGGGGKIKFKIYPQSKDIKWAANTDVYSGSVWDASEKVSKDKKSELLGVSYSKYPAIGNVDKIQPNLASIVDNLAHHHNELGISLTGNNFRLEYDEDIPYSTKKIIDSVNSILDQKYGKLVKPEVEKSKKQTILDNPLPENERSGVLSYSSDYDGGYFLDTIYEYERRGYALGDKIGSWKVQQILKIVYPNSNVTIAPITNKVLVDGKDIVTYKGLKFETSDKIEKEVLGIQPTQTKETLKESVSSIKNKTVKPRTVSSRVMKGPGGKDMEWAVEYQFDLGYEIDSDLEFFNTEEEALRFDASLRTESVNKKEYTSQAFINTKIAKLKEVAKKYPRSLIRSEVKPISGAFEDNTFIPFDVDELPFQKIPSEISQEPMFQLKGTESSKASKETVALVKDFLKRIGVNIKQLENIVVDGVKQDANGAALIMQKLVLVTEGKENIALTEEAMHFAVEIIEQTNPALFNQLLKEINSYKLLNTVINDYGKLKSYQTPDGKPDIRKLKKEAIAKVLAETIVKKNEGSTEKPELLAKTQTWWQKIIDALKGLFSKSGFDQAAMKVLKGEAIGTVEDVRLNDEVYLQNALTPQQKIINKLREISSKIEKPSGEGGKYKINGKPIKLRVTDISKNWLEKRFEDQQLTKDDFDKAVDSLLAEKGTMLHGENDWMLKNHFLDSEGKFIKDEAFRPSDDGYVSQLSPANKTFYNKLKKSMEDRLKTFPANTVFLAETTIYDPKRDLAGTVDFIAVEPDGKTHILDWKFKRISNVELQDDIPWYNVMSWRTQMKNYKSILSDAYGVTFDGSEQTRMIPFRAIYTKADKKKNIKPQLIDIEIGDVDPRKEERMYLVPVGLEEERTGEKRVDELITKLNQIYDTISDIKVSPEKKKEKAEQLNELYKAIRQLKMRGNLKPLIYQAGVLNKSIENIITEYYNEWDGKDVSQFSQDQRNEFSWRIQNYENSLSVYTTLYKNLKPLFQGELSEADKVIKEELREVTEEANDLQLSLEEVRQKFAENVVAKSVKILDYLKPEKIIKGFSSWFGSTSTLQNKSVQVLYKMANRAFSLASQETQTQGQILKDLKERYDKWARSKGLNARNYFDILKKKPGYNKEAVEEKRKDALEDLKLRKDLFSEKEYKNEVERINKKFDKELKGKNELIDEYNPRFYNILRKSTKDRDFEWIKENVDINAYKEYIEEKKQEEIERAKAKTRYGSEFSIKKQLNDDLIKIQLMYDISSTEGLGWLLYDDLRKFPKEQWKSAEWKELYKKDASGNYVNAPAVDFYEYIKERNEYFEAIGYISPKQERTFLPYIRKGLVEKITMGGNVTLFESTLRAITVSEGDVGYGEIDPITKQPVYTIPKYFTKDTGEEVSNDLFKNMTLINESALRYQYLSEIEGQLHLIVKTEANKEAIKTSYFGKTKLNADGEPERTNDNTENTQIVRDMMEGIVYGHKFIESQTFDQLLIGLGNFGKRANEKLGINIFPEEFDNTKISLNKSINWINNAFQLKALGLNPLSSIATLFGGTFQSTINAGKYFTKTEFLKNEFLMASRMNGVDAKKYVGALQYFLPLTENNNKLVAAKLSLTKFNEEALQDMLMILMRSADQFVQTVNFFSFLDNTIVENGQLFNVREYLRTTPEYSQIYSVSGEERKRLNKKFEEDVKKLIAEKGVINLSTIEGNEFVIPGVNRKSDTVIELRRKVQGITKDALGNLSEDDIRRINLNIYGKSFMVFKNWIPRLVDVRMGNLKYNSATEAYEWGRTRMLMRWLTEEKLRVFGALKSAILGNDEVWVEQMRRLYEKKKSDYEKDTGKKLMMTETEFIQLASQNIKNQAVDVLFYLALTGLLLAAKGYRDDEKKRKIPTSELNKYNLMIRALDKVTDEVAYFFNPLELVNLTKGGLFPSVGLIDNYIKVFKNFSKEMYAIGIDDEKTANKNYVIKYLLKGFPVTSQFDTIFLLFFPDLAKDLGMKAQSESRPVGR